MMRLNMGEESFFGFDNRGNQVYFWIDIALWSLEHGILFPMILGVQVMRLLSAASSRSRIGNER